MPRCFICSTSVKSNEWIDPRLYGVDLFDGAFCVYCCGDCIPFIIWVRDAGSDKSLERLQYWIKRNMGQRDGGGYMHTQCLECSKLTPNVSWDGLCSNCINYYLDSHSWLLPDGLVE
jgi:hypothetical protein